MVFRFRYLTTDEDISDLSLAIKKMIQEQSQQQLTQAAFSSLIAKFLGVGQDLLNYNDPKDAIKYKLAGLAMFDCILEVNDDAFPQKRIEICNMIFKLLKNEKLPPPGMHVNRRTYVAISYYYYWHMKC
jgi:hypothetical protein